MAVRNSGGLAMSLREINPTGLVAVIGLPEEKLCIYCWDGREG